MTFIADFFDTLEGKKRAANPAPAQGTRLLAGTPKPGSLYKEAPVNLADWVILSTLGAQVVDASATPDYGRLGVTPTARQNSFGDRLTALVRNVVAPSSGGGGSTSAPTGNPIIDAINSVLGTSPPPPPTIAPITPSSPPAPPTYGTLAPAEGQDIARFTAAPLAPMTGSTSAPQSAYLPDAPSYSFQDFNDFNSQFQASIPGFSQLP